MAAIYCRCCGKEVWHFDREPIHTGCIARHWRDHKFGKGAGRCREFGPKGKEPASDN